MKFNKYGIRTLKRLQNQYNAKSVQIQKKDRQDFKELREEFPSVKTQARKIEIIVSLFNTQNNLPKSL